MNNWSSMEKMECFVKKYCLSGACREELVDYFNQFITFAELSKDKNYIYL